MVPTVTAASYPPGPSLAGLPRDDKADPRDESDT
jgi:hypothetical protein